MKNIQGLHIWVTIFSRDQVLNVAGRGQISLFLPPSQKKRFFFCNPNMESLMCNNDTIFRYRGLKKIEQVHTTTVFEFSKKKRIEINEFYIF